MVQARRHLSDGGMRERCWAGSNLDLIWTRQRSWQSDPERRVSDTFLTASARQLECTIQSSPGMQ